MPSSDTHPDDASGNGTRTFLDNPAIDEAMHRAAKRAIAWHHFEGRDVPIMERDGRIVLLKPDGTHVPAPSFGSDRRGTRGARPNDHP